MLNCAKVGSISLHSALLFWFKPNHVPNSHHQKMHVALFLTDFCILVLLSASPPLWRGTTCMPITLCRLHDKKTIYMCMLVTKQVVLDLSIVMEKFDNLKHILSS